MANDVAAYNPLFYAQEGLELLEKALGLSARVHLGYDEERRAFRRGEYVNIRKPGTFVAADAPAAATDLDTETVQIQLAYHREVKFELDDKTASFTGPRLVEEHVAPMAYALADDIDQKLAGLYDDVPWHFDQAAGTTAVADVTSVHAILFNNSVPMEDGRLAFMVDGNTQADLLALQAFSQYQGAGDEGVRAQMRGTLGQKFGMEFFANQNTPSHADVAVTDVLGTVVGAHAKGLQTLSVTALEFTQAFIVGDIISVAGHTQRYVLTSAGLTDGSGADVFDIKGSTPTSGLEAALSGGEVVTMYKSATLLKQDMAFHRNAFALVMAPLSELGNNAGAKMATLRGRGGVTLRSRIFYDGANSKTFVAMDVLYGVQTLNGNMACRLRRPV